MANHEIHKKSDTVHLLLGFRRKKYNKDGVNQCIRMVIKDFDEDVKVMEARIKAIGGNWRIHKTVNARCVHKARIEFMKQLIEYPEKATYLESVWRTTLLQTKSKAERKFMFDVDFDNIEQYEKIIKYFKDNNLPLLESHPTPNGCHLITEAFDTRELLTEFKDYVTLLRDGFVFIKEVYE